MSIEVSDVMDPVERALQLGIKSPENFSILPRGFLRATDVSKMCHEASAQDLRTLLRANGQKIAIYQPDTGQIPFIRENDNTFVGPLIFFGAAAISENPHLISITLNVIGNYVTDFFKGSPQEPKVKLSVLVETTQTKATTKTAKLIEFEGPTSELQKVQDIIKDLK
jgi:hypothetical protein